MAVDKEVEPFFPSFPLFSPLYGLSMSYPYKSQCVLFFFSLRRNIPFSPEAIDKIFFIFFPFFFPPPFLLLLMMDLF